MAIRAYGKSVKSYTAWVAETAYSITDYRVPISDNGFVYECTQAGTSGETEPTWPTGVGQTVEDGTEPTAVVWACREKAEEAGSLSVTLSLISTGGFSQKDIWVKSPGTGDFIVYGSYNGVDWRRIDELSVPHPSGRDNRHKGIQNAYPFIKVETNLNYVNEIEIVAGQA